MLRYKQLHQIGKSKLLSKAIQNEEIIEPYIETQTGGSIEPYIENQTGEGADKRPPKEKRLDWRNKNADMVESKKRTFFIVRDIIDKLKNEFLTGRTRNDLPIHNSEVKKIPDKIAQKIILLKERYDEFIAAYNKFLTHEKIVLKKKYGAAFNFGWIYDNMIKIMEKAMQRVSHKDYLSKIEPIKIPEIKKEEVKEEEVKEQPIKEINKDNMPSKTKLNELAIILKISPKELANLYQNKPDIEEIKEEVKEQPVKSSNLVKYPISKIKEEIANIPKSVWWREKNGEFIVIAKGDSDEEVDKIMRDKVAAKPKKYFGKQIIRMHYHFTENKSLSFGEVLFTFFTIIAKDKINKNLNLEAINGKTGTIWFTKEWLELHGFKPSYITNMLGAIYNDKVKISIKPTMYEMIGYKHNFKKKSKSKPIEKPIEKSIEVPVVKEPEIKGSDKLSDVIVKGLSIDEIVKKLKEMKNS
jgi:hypothetical protein